MTDPDYKSNGKGEGEIPVFRVFKFDQGWDETDPATGEDIPVDREDIISDLDIDEEEDES